MSEVEMENLLDALTDALLSGQDDHAVRLSRVNEEMGILTRLMVRLRDTLQPREPSERFMRQLKHDLTGEPQGLRARLGAVPVHVHVATGVAASIAGLMWFSRRQSRPNNGESADLPALQQES